MTLTTAAAPRVRTATRPVVLLVLALVVLAAAARLVFLVLHPPVDERIYDHHAMSEVRTTWWVTHVYLAGPGFPVAFGGFGALVAALCARVGRGLVPALVGAVLAGAGGLLSGLGFAAEGVTWGYLTDPAVVDEATGTAVLAAVGEHPAMIDVPVLGGFVLAGVGGVLLLVALRRSSAAPRWVPAAGLVALVLGQLLPWPEALRAVPPLADTAVVVGVSVLAARVLLRRAQP